MKLPHDSRAEWPTHAFVSSSGEAGSSIATVPAKRFDRRVRGGLIPSLRTRTSFYNKLRNSNVRSLSIFIVKIDVGSGLAYASIARHPSSPLKALGGLGPVRTTPKAAVDTATHIGPMSSYVIFLSLTKGFQNESFGAQSLKEQYWNPMGMIPPDFCGP